MGPMTAAASGVLYDPEAAATTADLYESYRTLRDEHPVYQDPNGRFVALTRFADVAEAATDAATYSSEITANTTLVHPILAQLDPPRHTAMRRLILRAFTASRVAERETEIRAIAVELLDRALGKQGFDLVTEFAALLPSIVMGRLIGIPEELVPTCREISDLHMRRITQRDALVPMRMSDELFRPLLAARRAAPADDLLSALVTAEVDGRGLTDEELLGFCYLLLIGGNDTTTNWIGNAAVLFGRSTDVRDALAGDPSLLPAALEEALRLESPTQVLPRRATRDITLHDTRITAGTRVLLVWGAANRDEREFADPERFDPHRHDMRHLAFGQGIHFCLGAALARMEARVAFEELLLRMPAYELAAEPEPVRSSWALGYAHVPIV
jgi:cytochrome P450